MYPDWSEGDHNAIGNLQVTYKLPFFIMQFFALDLKNDAPNPHHVQIEFGIAILYSSKQLQHIHDLERKVFV